MGDDLINLSLNQGKQFKNYQKKIKTRIENQIEGIKGKQKNKKSSNIEGFATNAEPTTNLLEEKDNRYEIITQTNQADNNLFNKLQNQNNNLQNQYNNTQKQVNSRSLVLINRTSPNNSYLNKNISLLSKTSDYNINDLGYGGYVTGQGVFKPYPDQTTFNSVAGKNGCPKNVMTNIPVNEFSSSFLQGTNMKANQSCGNEGKNVYVSKLADNPTSSYVGCYFDKPIATNVIAIPLMNSSNLVNGFRSLASSVYDDNNAAGPWAAFDQNPNTMWHSKYTPSNAYNSTTGEYQGINNIKFNSVNSGILTVKGEYLQINLPNNTSGSSPSIKVVQYDIAPRLDGNLFLQRSPNSWYLLGYKDGQWYEVDRRIGQKFTSGRPKTYIVANPGNYVAYNIIVEKVGNDDKSGLRDSVQIAEFKLYINSDTTFTNNNRAMIFNPSVISYTTFDKCQKYAIENEYQYFGLQDVQPDGTAACLVSNDYERTIGYGDASKQVIPILLWSSNTATDENNTMQIEGSGRMTIYDMNSRSIFNSNGGDPICKNWGTLMVDSATYGGNCKAPIGNGTKKVGFDLGCNWSRSCSIPISNNTFGDPNPGCAKSFDAAYKCGGKSFTKNLSSAEGQTMILDCGDYMNTECQYYLILQDDCNMCLYRGKDPSDQKNGIWMSNTNGKQKGANPDWVASKGKYGRNYMKTGETLSADQWIGSNDGSIRLMMQKDGNLVLYTSETKLGCSVKNNITSGTGWVNAVYKVDPTGNRNLLGKMAYIDDEANLREYPASLLTKSNQYQLIDNADSLGNDIQETKTTTGNQGCIDACNTNKDCSGFVYQPKGNLCYLKNNGMYPNGKKQFYPNSGIILGVRKPQIGSSVNSSCNKDIVDIDTIKYNNYTKGSPMTTDAKCGTSIVTSEDISNLTKIQNNTLSVDKKIQGQGTQLYNEYNNNNDLILTNSDQLNENIDMYKETDNKIKSQLNFSDNKEGMENIDKNKINMNDINSMLSDTDIKLLQENYSYIFWSILAIGILTVTINK
jgi:hypothetical protein